MRTAHQLSMFRIHYHRSSIRKIDIFPAPPLIFYRHFYTIKDVNILLQPWATWTHMLSSSFKDFKIRYFQIGERVIRLLNFRLESRKDTTFRTLLRSRKSCRRVEAHIYYNPWLSSLESWRVKTTIPYIHRWNNRWRFWVSQLKAVFFKPSTKGTCI